MVFESTISQVSQFTDSLNVRQSPALEKSADEQAQDARNPNPGGDTVSISPEARALIAPENSGDSKDTQGDAEKGLTLSMGRAFGLNPEQEKHANKLFDELDTIFGSGNELTSDQEERVGAIIEELDTLLPVERELQFSEEDENRLDALFKELDALYTKEKLTPEQEKQALKLENEIESIFDNAANAQQDGDVTFSTESMKPEQETKEEATSTTDQTIERLKEQIEKLEEEIKELEKDDTLSEKEKNTQLQQKQAQLMELNEQLLKAQQEELKASGQAIGGGTRANGFGNSVASF